MLEKIFKQIPEFKFCPKCEEKVKNNGYKICDECRRRKREYEEKYNCIIDIGINGAPGAPGESGW